MIAFDLNTDLLVGARFHLVQYPDGSFGPRSARGGQGMSIVIDEMPISGPVVRETTVVVGQPDEYRARCLSCRVQSLGYKRKNEPSLRVWAHAHRCGLKGRNDG